MGKNGDILSCAHHYIKNHKHLGYKPLWICNYRYRAVLDEMFPDEFEVFPVDVPTNQPLQALALAKFRFPLADIQVCQQNGYDDQYNGIREYGNFQSFQQAQLDQLFNG